MRIGAACPVERRKTTIYEQMLTERDRLIREIRAIRNKLSKLPAGQLICTKNRNRFKWYRSDGSKQSYTYIPKGKRELAEQLAAKKYLTLLEEELIQEQKAVESYLELHSGDESSAGHLLSDHSGYRELLSPYFRPLSQELQEWSSAPYEHNEKYPEKLIHKTCAGVFVRSKSEAMIAAFLYMNKIPFRYECAVYLGEVTGYPDFTIRHPQTGQIYYWEHFGMMDNSEYRKKALTKLELYAANGIYPSVQLLMTFETKGNPLNAGMIENILKFYFL